MLGKILVHIVFKWSRRFLTGRLYPVRDLIFLLLRIRIKDVCVPVGNFSMYIDTNNYHERSMFTFGAFERGTTRFLKRYISSLTDCVIIAVGANVGLHILTMCDTT